MVPVLAKVGAPPRLESLLRNAAPAPLSLSPSLSLSLSLSVARALSRKSALFRADRADRFAIALGRSGRGWLYMKKSKRFFSPKKRARSLGEVGSPTKNPMHSAHIESSVSERRGARDESPRRTCRPRSGRRARERPEPGANLLSLACAKNGVCLWRRRARFQRKSESCGSFHFSERTRLEISHFDYCQVTLATY